MEVDSSLMNTAKTMKLVTAKKASNDGESLSTESFTSLQCRQNRPHLNFLRCLQVLIYGLLLVGLAGLVVAVVICGVKWNARIEALESKLASLEGQQFHTVQFCHNITELQSSIANDILNIQSSTNQSIMLLEERTQEIEKSIASANASAFVGCYDDEATCTINVHDSNMYYKGCRTNLLSRNIKVSILCKKLVTKGVNAELHHLIIQLIDFTHSALHVQH